MALDKDDVISTLNDLIETCKDGENGFRTCSDAVDNPQLKTLFTDRARGCADAASELQSEVKQLGGDAEDSGSLSGSMHQGWINLKSAITGKDEAAVIAECERGEDAAIKSYEEALEEDLPSDIRSLVERQYQGARRNHDMIRNLEQSRSRI